MKRIIASLAAIAMMAGAAPAFAGTIVTPSPSTFTLTGAVTVSQSVTLNCMLTLNVAVDAAGNCAGTLVVTWNNAKKKASVNGTVFGTNFGASKACVIAGKLKSSNLSLYRSPYRLSAGRGRCGKDGAVVRRA